MYLGNLRGERLQIVINEVLAALIGKTESEKHPAPSWASKESQPFFVVYHE